MPQQGLWFWPGPLAGKQARGGSGVRAQASPGTYPCAGAGSGLQCGAQAVWACLPHGALGVWPTGLPEAGRVHMAWSRDGSLPRLKWDLASLGSQVSLKPAT